VAQQRKGLQPQWQAFFAELERSGFTEGSNLEIERYSGEGRSDGYTELAEYIVGRNPDVIFVVSLRPVLNFKSVTDTIPKWAYYPMRLLLAWRRALQDLGAT